MFSGEDQIVERLGPDLRALVVFRQLGIAFVRSVFAAAFQGFSHRLMQQSAPRPADVAIDHFANLVMTEVVDAALGLLTQQMTADQRIDRIKQLRLGLTRNIEQSIEVEAPTEHGDSGLTRTSRRPPPRNARRAAGRLHPSPRTLFACG